MSAAEAAGSAWSWPVLRDAQRTILLDLLVHGRRSRADLGRRSGLSRASLSRLARELTELGFVREIGAVPDGARGRPSEMIEIVPGGASFLGFKLTGDALYAAVIDLAGEVVRVASGELSDTSPEAVIEQIARATAALRGRHPRLSAVGVCLAGDVRHDPSLGAVVTDSAFLGWDETPLQRPLAEATGLPVAISNDVQALTMGHHWFGAGRGTSSLAVLGLGAGIGCGLVLEGGRVDGANGHPGKVGHLPVGLDDARCDHGHAGCVSAYVTIPAILRRLGAEDFEAVLAAHAEQDPEAVAALRRAAVALGAVVATITNLVDPERVVVTGEALAVARLHPDVLEGAVRERLDPSSVAPEIVCPDFAFTDYARGAAVTALHALV